MKELPKRKSPRLKNYDYSTQGIYFITICTHNYTQILSKINVGAIHESPVNTLTQYGVIVDDIIKNIPKRFDNIKIDKYVIMPNHIHMIIEINENRAIRESPLHLNRSIISKIIGYLKMNASKQINLLYTDNKIWQRSYHDHIIRGENDYKNIWQYIDTNVIRWKFDKYYNQL